MSCDETPESLCPACRTWRPKYDGFGVPSCAACGYCEHASQSGDGAGHWKCNACGKTLGRLAGATVRVADDDPD